MVARHRRLIEPALDAEGPAATAMWLFDGKATQLPGGFDAGELSANSPVSVLQSFPQDLVLVGRSSGGQKRADPSADAFRRRAPTAGRGLRATRPGRFQRPPALALTPTV